MKTRLADIAAQAGVSEATVSRVLNSRPGVAEDTRRAVLTALDVLGYERPARLRRRSAGLVGLMVPELDNPIFPAFAQVIERALAHHGYTPVLCTQTPGGATEDDYTELLLERGVSGIIFVSGLHSDSGADTSRYVRLVERGLPVVFVNGWADGIDAPFISSDESVAVELAIGHLASLRHRRIGLAVGPERYVPTARKIAGFRRGLKETFGVDDADPWIERSLFSVEGGQAAAGTLLDRGATAIVCGSDLMALGVIRAVRERGMSVPGDVSVVGYDDSPLVAFTDPPLTTVRQAVAPMGAAAVRALLDEIGGGRAPRTELVYRPELVVRGSTGPVAVPDAAVPDAVLSDPALSVADAGVAGAANAAVELVVDAESGQEAAVAVDPSVAAAAAAHERAAAARQAGGPVARPGTGADVPAQAGPGGSAQIVSG